MTSSEIRKKFLEFFEKNGHTIVPSSSLIPDDPSVLLTTAGMQQFKPYYTGEADPMATIHPTLGRPLGSRNAVSIQKSFRTSDIDEVGDDTHLTFFEMLGNFSFGYKPGFVHAGTVKGEPGSPKEGYFKEEAIRLAHEFITMEVGLPIKYVTVFEGLDSIGVPEDRESQEIWKKYDPNIMIKREGIEDVFWGPTGTSGPCGPTTELYCENANGQDVEIWNLVFNEFFFAGTREELLSGTSEKKLEKLKNPGVDTGMGFERLCMIAQNKKNIFETDLFEPLMKGFPDNLPVWERRIITDHIRAIAFLISDGLRPSNKEAGYVLRRLLRRVIAFTYEENIGHPPQHLLQLVVNAYKSFPDYQNLYFVTIEKVFTDEYEKFMRTLGLGRKEFEHEADKIKAQKVWIMPRAVIFNLYQSAGVTIDILDDLAKKQEVEIDKKAFTEDLEHHKEISRAGQEKKFGGHGLLLDTGELKAANEEELKVVTRLHTATHLLQAALRKVLGTEVTQQGSDITAERTRFDFTFPRKLTPDEIRQVEDLVNGAIQHDFSVEYKEMPYEEAIKTGALYFFKEKYPSRVKVYSAFDAKTGEVFSREFCGGPHVSHTGEIGRFRITKEESSSAGVRRIRGKVE